MPNLLTNLFARLMATLIHYPLLNVFIHIGLTTGAVLEAGPATGTAVFMVYMISMGLTGKMLHDDMQRQAEEKIKERIGETFKSIIEKAEATGETPDFNEIEKIRDQLRKDLSGEFDVSIHKIEISDDDEEEKEEKEENKTVH